MTNGTVKTNNISRLFYMAAFLFIIHSSILPAIAPGDSVRVRPGGIPDRSKRTDVNPDPATIKHDGPQPGETAPKSGHFHDRPMPSGPGAEYDVIVKETYPDTSYYEFDNSTEYVYSVSTDNSRWISLGVSAGMFNSPEFNKALQFEFSSGRYVDNYSFIQITGGYEWIPVNDKSRLKNTLKDNVSLLNFGLDFKFLFPPDYTGIEQYFLAGLSYNHISWKYKNPGRMVRDDLPDGPITINDDEDDWVAALDIHAALGFVIVDNEDSQVCSEISPGYIVTGILSHQGFENTIINNSFYLKLKLALCFSR